MKNRTGFTLVEVLVAIAVLGVFAGVISYGTQSFTYTRNAQIFSQIQGFSRSYFDALKSNWKLQDTYIYNRLPTIKNVAGVQVPFPPPEGLKYDVVVSDVTNAAIPVLLSYPYDSAIKGATILLPSPIPQMKRVEITITHKVSQKKSVFITNVVYNL